MPMTGLTWDPSHAPVHGSGASLKLRLCHLVCATLNSVVALPPPWLWLCLLLHLAAVWPSEAVTFWGLKSSVPQPLLTGLVPLAQSQLGSPLPNSLQFVFIWKISSNRISPATGQSPQLGLNSANLIFMVLSPI